jgi:AraC family transcriptional regulator
MPILPSAVAQEWLRPVCASSQTESDSDTPEGPGYHMWNARRGLARRNLVRACSYMENNLGRNFTLDELARAVGISRFHFSRLFRESTGESPMGYTLRLRVERAKEMLLQSDRRISEIAVTLGFFDQSHFSRTFRRITGISPGDYVRMCDVAEPLPR